jgi:DNA polymerase-3 subunit gamma/tau
MAFKSSRFKSVVAMEESVIQDVQKQEDNQPSSEQFGDGSFTKEEASNALRAFADQRDSTTEKMIFQSDFELRDQFTIHFKLLNKLKEDVLNELKQEMLDFVRKRLQNSSIQVSSEVTAEETKAKPRTEQEKFEAMAKKNPALKDLKERLGLDLVY